MGKLLIYFGIIILFVSIISAASRIEVYDYDGAGIRSKINYTLISADELRGALNWTFLQNYPVACPVGTFVTEVNDTITCTAPTAEDVDPGTFPPGNYTFQGNVTADFFFGDGAGLVNVSVPVKVFAVNVTAVSGNAAFTTPRTFDNIINSFIINATSSNTTFRFEALENISLIKLDSNLQVHTGTWHVIKNVATANENITMKIINASADENFSLSFRYT